MADENGKKEYAKARDILLKNGFFGDTSEAERYLKIAAEKGNKEAQYQYYGLLWQNKAGLYDEINAMEWCEKSAKNGYAPAQYAYAIHLLYGDGIKQDVVKAMEWLERASFQKYKLALVKLRSLYLAGNRIERNIQKASFWQNKEKKNDTRKEKNTQDKFSMADFEYAQELRNEEYVPDKHKELDMACLSLSSWIQSEYAESCIVQCSSSDALDAVENRLKYLEMNNIDLSKVIIVGKKDNLFQYIQVFDKEEYAGKIRLLEYEIIVKTVKEVIARYEYNGIRLVNGFLEKLSYGEMHTYIRRMIERDNTVLDKIVENWEYVCFIDVDSYKVYEKQLIECVISKLEEKGYNYVLLMNT